MNQQAFDAGKVAYQRGDLSVAVSQLSQAKGPGEVSGAVDHLLGNCLMKLGRYGEAAASYGDALRDPSYGHSGALACNRGRALLAAGRPQEAIASLTMATKDETYTTPYKAQVALGNAFMRIGNVREAGVAYRSAAIDESNPDPASALRSLGGCFMQMGRAVDAVEAYRTALDFSTPLQDQNAVYGDLGLAYVAANRMTEAVDAFGHATADGSYQLRPEAQAAYDAAQRAVSAITGGGPSETDALLAAAGYGTGSYDPLDPMGTSGEFMPSPEDTGFFSVNEQDAVWDIAQSTISSLTMGELLALDGKDGATFYERLNDEKMNYGWIEGSAEFKEEVAKLYKKDLDPRNILQTNGCTGANMNALLVLVKPGDHVIAEWPTYSPLYEIPRSLGAQSSSSLSSQYSTSAPRERGIS